MNILQKYIDKKINDEIERKNQLLKTALIFLKEDLEKASDLIEYSALKTTIYKIEKELKKQENK